MDRNGYFSVINKPDGTYIKCVSSIDNGAPININDIIFCFDAKNITDYDLKAVNAYITAGNYSKELCFP